MFPLLSISYTIDYKIDDFIINGNTSLLVLLEVRENFRINGERETVYILNLL